MVSEFEIFFFFYVKSESRQTALVGGGGVVGMVVEGLSKKENGVDCGCWVVENGRGHRGHKW